MENNNSISILEQYENSLHQKYLLEKKIDEIEHELDFTNGELANIKNKVSHLRNSIINELEKNTQYIENQKIQYKYEYDPESSYREKIIHIAKYADLYVGRTLKGTDYYTVVSEIEEIKNEEELASTKNSISPIISTLVNDGVLIKCVVKGTKNDFRFLSVEWFDEFDNIKDQYAKYYENLEKVSNKNP